MKVFCLRIKVKNKILCTVKKFAFVQIVLSAYKNNPVVKYFGILSKRNEINDTNKLEFGEYKDFLNSRKKLI